MCTSLFSVLWEKGARECKLHVRCPLGYNGRCVLPTDVFFNFIFTALYVSEAKHSSEGFFQKWLGAFNQSGILILALQCSGGFAQRYLECTCVQSSPERGKAALCHTWPRVSRPGADGTALCAAQPAMCWGLSELPLPGLPLTHPSVCPSFCPSAAPMQCSPLSPPQNQAEAHYKGHKHARRLKAIEAMKSKQKAVGAVGRDSTADFTPGLEGGEDPSGAGMGRAALNCCTCSTAHCGRSALSPCLGTGGWGPAVRPCSTHPCLQLSPCSALVLCPCLVFLDDVYKHR